MVQGELRRDFPRILALYQTGKLKLDELISQRYRLDQISKTEPRPVCCSGHHGAVPS